MASPPPSLPPQGPFSVDNDPANKPASSAKPFPKRSVRTSPTQGPSPAPARPSSPLVSILTASFSTLWLIKGTYSTTSASLLNHHSQEFLSIHTNGNSRSKTASAWGRSCCLQQPPHVLKPTCYSSPTNRVPQWQKVHCTGIKRSLIIAVNITKVKTRAITPCPFQPPNRLHTHNQKKKPVIEDSVSFIQKEEAGYVPRVSGVL